MASNAAALGALCEPRDEAALRALAVDGEAAYALLDAPRLLCAARALLVDALDALAPHHSLAAPWWAARCAMLHQRCLDAPAPTLEKEATHGMRRALEALERMAGGPADAGAPASEPQPAAGTAGSSLVGRKVLVLALEGRPELNGQIGLVKAYDEAKGRCAVQLEGGGTPMLLKPDNLALTNEVCCCCRLAM